MIYRYGRPRGTMRDSRERGDPRKLGTRLVYWHAADRGVTLALTVVSSHADSGPGGRTATQSTDARRPLYVANGVLGLPTIRYDGSDDLMNTGSFTTAQPSRVFLAMKMVAAQASDHDTVWSRGPSVALFVDTTPRSIVFAGAAVTHNAVIADGAFARVELVLNGASSSLVVNDATLASGDAGAEAGGIVTYGSYNSGTTHATNVEFQEQFEVSGTLSQSELTRLRNRQKARIGV